MIESALNIIAKILKKRVMVNWCAVFKDRSNGGTIKSYNVSITPVTRWYVSSL